MNLYELHMQVQLEGGGNLGNEYVGQKRSVVAVLDEIINAHVLISSLMHSPSILVHLISFF